MSRTFFFMSTTRHSPNLLSFGLVLTFLCVICHLATNNSAADYHLHNTTCIVSLWICFSLCRLNLADHCFVLFAQPACVNCKYSKWAVLHCLLVVASLVFQRMLFLLDIFNCFKQLILPCKQALNASYSVSSIGVEGTHSAATATNVRLDSH